MDDQPPFPRPTPEPGPDAPQYSPRDPNSYLDQFGPAPSWGQPPPPPPPQAGTGRSLLVGIGVAAVAIAVLLSGVALTSGSERTISGSGTLELPANPTVPVPGQPATPGGSAPAGRSGAASAVQQIGVVTIVSTLKYQSAQSAGTGIILSADGTVLTNNHVIRGSTSITVTVTSTGRSYPATVVGTAPASDVAVIKMTGAAGLSPAKFATKADVRIGDAVVGVGNAGGTNRLTAASGKVTALDQAITAADETGRATERLTGLIEVDAKIISGDSGGPLYNAAGQIVGVNTAASAAQATNPRAYAIPIENAMSLVARIKSGVRTAEIHIGYPGFLGVQTRDANGRGALVVGLLDGGPAAAAGVTAGSVITAVDGTPVASSTSLRTLLTNLEPGRRVNLTWTDASGSTQRATMTLAVGPAD